jgi:hypothetical protein
MESDHQPLPCQPTPILEMQTNLERPRTVFHTLFLGGYR